MLSFTPLAVAAQNGHLAVVVSLLQAGADPRLADRKGAPPMHKAAGKDHAAVLVALLEHGCDVEQVNRRCLLESCLFNTLMFPEGLL